MARRIIGAAFVSLDGVMQAPGGPTEDPRGGFEHGGWMAAIFEEAVGSQVDTYFKQPFDLLLGRRTYDIFAAHWPFISPDEDEIAAMFARNAKFVLTRSDRPLDWQGSHRLADIDAVAELKAGDGPDLVIQGSSTIYPPLLERGLIDRLVLIVAPLVLGSGKRLFGEGTPACAFKPVEQRLTPGGFVMSTWEPAGPVNTASLRVPAAEPSGTRPAGEHRGGHLVMLALYGHAFSSYTWKALIPLYANGTTFAFRQIDEEQPEHAALVQQAHPAGKFPVLADGERTVIEATAIIEHLAAHHPGPAPLIPADPAQAVIARMLDRVFDNYVMASMQRVVNAYIADADSPEPGEVEAGRAGLRRAYDWLERWLSANTLPPHVSLVSCAAASSLFYADWVERVSSDWPRLAALRAELLALSPVSRCVEDARPYRPFFPLKAPDRD